MSKLDKSWFAHICKTSGITVKHDVIIEKYVAEFQEEAIKTLEKEYKRLDKLAEPAYPNYYNERNGIRKAIEIIKNLKKIKSKILCL